jgi:hypothetical protein
MPFANGAWTTVQRAFLRTHRGQRPKSNPFALPDQWKSVGATNSHNSFPTSIIPRNGPPTARFPASIFSAIEQELCKPAQERNMPEKQKIEKIRNFGSLPEKSQVSFKKGKLKSSLKKMMVEAIRNQQVPEVQVF